MSPRGPRPLASVLAGAIEGGQTTPTPGPAFEPVFRSLDPAWSVLGLPPGDYRLRFPSRLDASGEPQPLDERPRAVKVRAGEVTDVDAVLEHVDKGLVVVGVIAAGEAAIPKTASEVLGHLAVTASGLVGQFALTEGLARTGAARATAVTMSGPIFGMLFELWFFGVAPSAASVAGAALVIGALVLLALWGPRAAA